MTPTTSANKNAEGFALLSAFEQLGEFKFDK